MERWTLLCLATFKFDQVRTFISNHYLYNLGFVDTPKDYDLFKGSQVKASVALNEKDVCHNGHSSIFYVPNKMW